jgi:hypothetical protein
MACLETAVLEHNSKIKFCYIYFTAHDPYETMPLGQAAVHKWRHFRFPVELYLSSVNSVKLASL